MPANSEPQTGAEAPPASGSAPPDAPPERRRRFEGVRGFGFTYVAILSFILLYVFTVLGLENRLTRHFNLLADQAASQTEFSGPVQDEIQRRIHNILHGSLWVQIGGVEVTPVVIGRDGSWIYVGGHTVAPPPSSLSQSEIQSDIERLLPATAFTTVSVRHNTVIANAILVFYAALLIQTLWLRNRSIARREAQQLEAAMQERSTAMQRSQQIERDLELMRQQFFELEPTDPEQLEEVAALRNERRMLQGKLNALETREQELRSTSADSSELSGEIRALEDLLEEASEEMSSKDGAIADLEKRLKRATKDAAAEESSRMRESEMLSRRYNTLYKNLEVDTRALDDIIALRDEGMKLKCEEKLKRLNDEADNVAVRRKVGGLPPHLTIFEIGFAGKGRVYYAKGKQRRFRVLNVGAKNTQNAALEYLRKL